MTDLDALIDALKSARGSMGESSFGWFRVDTSHPDQDGSPNSTPLAWTDMG